MRRRRLVQCWFKRSADAVAVIFINISISLWLPRRAADAESYCQSLGRYQGMSRVSAGQCFSTQCVWTLTSRYTRLYFTGTVATEQSNLVDYKIWATMQQRVYQTKIRNVDEMRHYLLNVLSSIEQDVIDASIDQWRVRLKARVRTGGGHIEHMLYIYLHRHTNKQITFVIDIKFYWN